MLKKWQKGNSVDVGIIGIPLDWGVNLSGGRVGSAEGPKSIREEFKKHGSTQDIEIGANFSTIKMVDFGDALVAFDISEDSTEIHNSVTKLTTMAIQNSDTVIALGGGHDNSYSTIKALSRENNGNIGGVNIDAHLDVRPVVDGIISSGTPFRRLIDNKYLDGKNFCEVGIQGHVNLKEHKDWLEQKGSDN